MMIHKNRWDRRAVLVTSLVLMPLLALGACSKKNKSHSTAVSSAEASPEASAKLLTVAYEQQPTWVRNFNPLNSEHSVRWPTHGGIYEPMLVFNTVSRKYVPWLATAYAWEEDNKRLVFTLRKAVKWSDGEAFTAKDVAFTFNLLQKHPAVDRQRVWRFLEKVEASADGAQVIFQYKQVYVPSLYYIGQQPIVPEHTWKDVADPVTFKNENPVATGPFTEIRRFENQIFELGKNPNYWQKGRPMIDGLRFPAFSGNDQINIALANGEVDWAGTFVPDIEKTFVAKDPENNKYWYPLTGGSVVLYPNTAKAPFDDVRVRKAFSMLIDREKVASIATKGYAKPSDPTAMSDAYAEWRFSEALAMKDWVSFNQEAAEALLDEAGLTKKDDGKRYFPGGAPLKFEINVPAGWSDWVRTAQIVAMGLKSAGIDAAPRPYDVGAWIDKLQKGQFDLSLGFTNEADTPYRLYREMLSQELKKEIGESASVNWHRYGSPAADALLDQFELTTDPAEQRRLSNELQLLFAKEAPAIPIFRNVSWGLFSTKRFTGFPHAGDPYVRLSPYSQPESLIVLTTIKPRN